MPKRSADTQLTKDDLNNGVAGEEQVNGPTTATSGVMQGRKIAKPRSRKPGAGTGGGGGGSLPNVFSPGFSQTPAAAAPLGGFGGNTPAAPSAAAPAQQFFGSQPAAPSASTGFANGSAGSFSFGQTPTPAPQPQTNGSGMFGGGFNAGAPASGSMFGNAQQPTTFGAQPANGMGMNDAPSKGMDMDGSAPSSNFSFGSNNTPAPSAPQSSSFNFTAAPSNFNFGGPQTTSAPFQGFGATTATSKPDAAAPSNFVFGGAKAASFPAPEANKNPATSGMSFTAGTTTAGPTMFGQNNAAPSTTFGSKPAETPASTTAPFAFGKATTTTAGPPLFGQNTTAPPTTTTTTTTTTFGNNNTAAAAPSFGSAPSGGLFADNKPATTAPSNMFGDNKTATTAAPSMFGDNKPATTTAPSMFGNNATATAPSTTFGAAPTPSLFGTNNKDKETAKAEPPKSMFGTKPTEAPMTFGAPTTEKAPQFGAPTEKPPMFGAAPSSTTDKPGFAFGAKPADKPASSGFAFGEKPAEKPVAFAGFGNTAEKPAEKPAPFAGFGNITEKPAEKPAAFGGFGSSTEKPAEKPASMFSGFGASKPAEKQTSMFAPPKTNEAAGSGFGTANGFGAPKPNNAVTQFSAPVASNASKELAPASPSRKRSPPLPANHHQWSSTQMTEYYNLFAMRSLNHFFREELSKADVLADLTPLCEAYIAESAKIKELQRTNQKYKFDNTVTGKRASEDTMDRNGKRRQMGEEPKKSTFSPGKSSSSQALASILGGTTSGPEKQVERPAFGGFGAPSASNQPKLAEKPSFGFKPPTSTEAVNTGGFKLAAKPAFGFIPPGATAKEPEKPKEQPKAKKATGSVFDQPPPAAAGNKWAKMFPPVDASTIPDDNLDNGDEDDAPAKTGGLFGRISSPKPVDTPAKSSFFDQPADNTWSPDKGVKFAGASNGLFAANKPATTAAAAPSIFGATKPAEGSSIFGSAKPANSIFGNNKPTTSPTTTTDKPATNGDSSEPSDDVPTNTPQISLGGKGPGEEDEDATFEIRAIIYTSSSAGIQKTGVGQLRVLVNRNNKKARIVTRTDGGKVLMNVGLQKEGEYKQKGVENVGLVKDFATGVLYMVKVGKEKNIMGVLEAVNKAKDELP